MSFFLDMLTFFDDIDSLFRYARRSGVGGGEGVEGCLKVQRDRWNGGGGGEGYLKPMSMPPANAPATPPPYRSSS